ncbi:Resolvase [[Clostridium] sordellii]|nr:Resolvase [[Clostridium] sordellii] [Paeniclostridium sordellii]
MYINIESGTKDKREQFKQMISDAKNRSFDIILTKELSIIVRNGKLSYEIKTLAENSNIHIIISDISFILNTIKNKSLLESINSSLNKKYKSSEKSLENIETKILKLMLRKNNHLRKFIDDYFSKNDYNNIIKAINSEINELKSKTLLLENQMSIKLTYDLSNGISNF